MSTSTPIAPLASAARTTSGASASIDLGIHQLVRLRITVSSASGTTPTLVVKVQTSTDAISWQDMATSATRTATGFEDLISADGDRYLRITWTIGGSTPSFTFGVAGSSTLVYASATDLARAGAGDSVLVHPDGSPFTAAELSDALEEATDEADDLIGADVFVRPLKAWPRSHRMHVARAARYHALTARGYNPDAQATPVRDPVRDGYKDAVAYWKMIAAGGGGEGFVDQTPDVDEGGAYVVTTTRRGWGRR